MRNEEIMVSICCITYNQHDYIAKAIESFLEQKTNFKYEIIIHDDASTDGTTDIIREYEKKYPNLIKPIYQSENQYSKGKKVTMIAMKKARGKYIAICEGDDYWIDENKLQLQVKYMEKHPKCSLTFHNAYTLDINTGEKYKMMKKTRRYYKYLGNYDMSDMAKLDFIPTASLMFRKQDIYKIPSFYERCIVGDLPLRLILTSFGYCHYIDRIMSMYVRGTGGSATDRFHRDRKLDVSNAIKYLEKKQECLCQINEFTNKEYEKGIQIAINRIESDKYMYKEDYRSILKNKKVFICLPRRRMLFVLLKTIKGVLNGKN